MQSMKVWERETQRKPRQYLLMPMSRYPLKAGQRALALVLPTPRGLGKANEVWGLCANCGDRAAPPYFIFAKGRADYYLAPLKEMVNKGNLSILVHPRCAGYLKDPKVQDNLKWALREV